MSSVSAGGAGVHGGSPAESEALSFLSALPESCHPALSVVCTSDRDQVLRFYSGKIH